MTTGTCVSLYNEAHNDCPLHSPANGPVFSLELALDSEGAHYNTDLTTFVPTLVEVFNRGIQSTHTVPQLEKVF